MNLFGVLDISGSALTAERQRAEIGASNLANAETTRTEGGGPYRRKMVVFASRPAGGMSFGEAMAAPGGAYQRGVAVQRTVADTSPPLQRFDPGHPDANADGYVSYPDINPVEEMVNLTEAARAYQLNVSAVQATKAMITESVEILR